MITAGADTAQQLVNELKHQFGIRAALFHEGMSLVERDRAAAWFADRDDGAPGADLFRDRQRRP